MAPTSSRRHLTVIGVLTAVAAVAALIWQLRDSDPSAILTGVSSVGWGFLLILALGGVRFALRAYAWSACVEPPARLQLRDAFAAVLAADAIGNVTALGPIVSEPAKVAFVRGRVDLVAAITALAVETLVYSLSVAAMIAAGIIALLLSFEVEPGVRDTSEIALALVAALLALAAWVLWRRPALVSRALGALPRGHAKTSTSRRDRVQRLEQEIYSFASRRRSVVVPLIGCEIAFHALGVLEVYITLMFIPYVTPSLLLAFVLEGGNRLITVMFKFVPMRAGVDEAGTEGLTQILGYGVGLGVTLALVRKGRMIVWSLVGGVLLLRKGLSARRILEESERERDRQV